jgi:ferredoxin-thioredoxin reductase catalytic subunit
MTDKVQINEDAEFVAEMREALARNNGYCPCAIEPTEDDRCICKDFRDKIADPDFNGWCNCGLYRKEKQGK